MGVVSFEHYSPRDILTLHVPTGRLMRLGDAVKLLKHSPEFIAKMDREYAELFNPPSNRKARWGAASRRGTRC